MNNLAIVKSYHVDNTLHVSGPGAELKRFLNEKWATLNRAEIGIGEYSICLLATKQLRLQQKMGTLRVFQYSLTCTEIKPRNDLEDYKNTDNEKRRQHASVSLLPLSCGNISVCDRRYFRKNTMINKSVQISTYTSVHSGRTSSKKNSSVQVNSAPSCHTCLSIAHT